MRALPARPEGELTVDFLQGLGYDADFAARILTLVDREAQLRSYLDEAASRGIRPVLYTQPEYPEKVLRLLGDDAPPVLFCAGDLHLLQTPCAGLVGSRELAPPGARFAMRTGALCAKRGVTLCSGGAAGADRTGASACLQAGGAVIEFLADNLAARLRKNGLHGRQLLLSEDGFDRPFSIQRAFSRNRLIHLMGSVTFVAQTACGSGGTWQGAMQNLRHGWSQLLVCDDGTPGARALIEQGGIPVSKRGPDDIPVSPSVRQDAASAAPDE